MTEFGLAKIEAAKKLGSWHRLGRPDTSVWIPLELAAALASNKRAREFFEGLAPTYQKHFIGWIISAKKPETRAKRVRESVALLVRREKLGLKQ